MKKLTGAICGLMLAAGISSAHAADTSKIDQRLTDSANVIDEVMAAPDRAIPQSILAKAQCVIVIPAVKKLRHWWRVRPGCSYLPHRSWLERAGLHEAGWWQLRVPNRWPEYGPGAPGYEP